MRGGDAFSGRTGREFIVRADHFLGELNAIHPFREGNGRAQLAFLGLIGNTFGHRLDFQRLRRDTFSPAMVASFSRDMRPLETELHTLLA